MNSLLKEVTGQKQIITIPRWFDRHVHIRNGEMLYKILTCTVMEQATGAIIMGNLQHPHETSTIAKANAYRKEIDHALTHLSLNMGKYSTPSFFNPRMTCYLTDEIAPDEVMRGFKENVWCAVKLMMAKPDGSGGTTNSNRAVKNLMWRYPIFEVMQKNQIPLLGHFEAVEDDVDEFDREIVSFEQDFIPLRKHFPELPIVFEHVTDRRVAGAIAGVKNLYATVTAHHLMINRNAMFSGGMNPGHYCRPVPKREEDRLMLRKIVTSGRYKNFGAGTDSAPHDERFKSQCYGCNAGIFTAPCAVELYTTVFDEDNALEHLSPFLSENFLDIYGMEVSSEKMTIERRPRKIPEKIGNVQVFKGGSILPWTLVS